MARTPIVEWEGHEYRFEEKGADWYWALGIVATAAIIASVLFGNYLLAAVIVVAAIAVGLTAARRSRIHRFALFDDGIAIDGNLYPFSSMLHFSVLEYADETFPPSLSLKTKHFLAPHLLIPIVGYDPVLIYEFMNERLPEGNHEESLTDRLVDLFRI